MKIMTLDQLKNRDIGLKGTRNRDKYEFKLKREILENWSKINEPSQH